MSDLRVEMRRRKVTGEGSLRWRSVRSDNLEFEFLRKSALESTTDRERRGAHIFERFEHGDTTSVGTYYLELGVLESESNNRGMDVCRTRFRGMRQGRRRHR